MEKYAVEYDNEKIKTASFGNLICPKCGRDMSFDSSIRCRDCGTEPFERQHGYPHGKDSQTC